MGDRRSDKEPSAGPKALPWGMDKAEMQPGSFASLTDDKLARFVIGQQKKTKFAKEREDRELRKKQADAEAAKIYASFVASFETEDETLGKAFVRGVPNNVEPSSSQPEREHPPGAIYRLKPKPSPAAANAMASTAFGSGVNPFTGKKLSEMDRMMEEMKQQEQREQQPTRKKRQIDQFLEEIKDREPVVPSSEEMAMGKGSFDNGDPETTNLYVGNLAATITEEALEAEFGRYGEVYSVKIMWPRTEEERIRKRKCGFVSFFRRKDADEARIALHDRELDGQPITVGWGKAVKIDPTVRRPTVASAPLNPMATVDNTGLGGNPKIVVELPSDQNERQIVDRLARYVAKDGLQFENAVRTREQGNPKYRFLFEMQSPLALYYKWKVYSLAMGDQEHSWRETSFQMVSNGSIWVPPKVSAVTTSMASTSRSKSRSRHRERESGRRRSRSRYSSSSSRSPSRSPRRKRARRSVSRSRSRSRHSRSESRHRQRSPSRSRSRGRHARRSSSSESSHSRRQERHRDRHEDEQDKSVHSHQSQYYDRRPREPTQGLGGSSGIDKDNKMLTGQQIARARDIERGRERNRLAPEEYDEFKSLLAELTLERESVKRTMGFAFDNSEAAVDLVGAILDAFKDPRASAVAQVAYLYVTSDILHNSSAAVKNASLFRTTFQDCLPQIVDQLRLTHKNMIGRMSANAMKEKVLQVLTAWESWSLFPPLFLVGLNATFLRKVEESEYSPSVVLDAVDVEEERLRRTCRQAGILSTGDARALMLRLQWLREFTAPKATSSVAGASKSDSIGPPVGQMDQAAANELDDRLTNMAKQAQAEQDDLDGEPMDEDELNGKPLDEEEDLDGEPIDGDDAASAGNAGNEQDDLDGEPLDGEDLDGEPLDGEPLDGEDLDGEPLDEADLNSEPF